MLNLNIFAELNNILSLMNNLSFYILINYKNYSIGYLFIEKR